MRDIKPHTDGRNICKAVDIDEIVECHYGHVYNLLRRLGHSRHISEDLCQETFMNAYKKIDQLRKPESAMCWLYKIALNVSRSYIKSNKLKNVMSYEDLSDLSHSVSQDVDFDSDLGRLTEAVKVLPEKFRQAVVLHYLEHLTIAESAEVAGVREGTFKSRLNRALKRLERSLKINGEVDCVCR